MQKARPPPASGGGGSDDDDGPVDPDGYEQLGRGYVVSSKLTPAERAAASSFKRPDFDVDEPEARPLPAAVRDIPVGSVLHPAKVQELKGAEATCVGISPTGNIVVVGCRAGELLVLNPHTLEVTDTISLRTKAAGAAWPSVVTSVRFRPPQASSGMQNVLLVTAGSRVLHVHASTKAVLNEVVEQGNNVNALRVREDGQVFATAGSDHAVRVYDEHTHQVAMTLDHGDGVATVGHSNDVFGLAWKGDDPQVLLSAGWDRTVQVWDLRLHRSVRSFFGPYVCGDGLDVHGDTLLTGSWRHHNALQLWDFGSGRLRCNLGPPEVPQATTPEAIARLSAAGDAAGAGAGSLLYAAAFGPGGDDKHGPVILTAGSGRQPVARVYQTDGKYYRLAGTLPLPSSGQGLDSVGHGKERQAVVVCTSHVVSLGLLPPQQ